MLGTNDLKKRFSLSAFDIAQGIGVLIRIVHQSAAVLLAQPRVLLSVRATRGEVDLLRPDV